jgi:hypothetical protein
MTKRELLDRIMSEMEAQSPAARAFVAEVLDAADRADFQLTLKGDSSCSESRSRS